MGWTPSPIIGYDPVPGVILGGALFFYPYQDHGWLGSGSVMVVPQQQGRVAAEVEVGFLRLSPRFDLESEVGFDNWRGRYYGVGARTPPEAQVETDPARLAARLGGAFRLGGDLGLPVHALLGWSRQRQAAAIAAIGGEAEGAIDGARAGARVALRHDTRDSLFSARYGGLRALWVEGWAVQGGALAPRARAGVHVAQFVPVLPPDVILAARASAGTSAGAYAFDTNYRLGGIDLLRGLLSDRLRGHHFAAGTLELRFPIVSIVSGAVYGESGTGWLDGAGWAPGDISHVGGGGLRFGLPPDFLIKLRFDAGFSADQWGIFFAFDEAF